MQVVITLAIGQPWDTGLEVTYRIKTASRLCVLRSLSLCLLEPVTVPSHCSLSLFPVTVPCHCVHQDLSLFPVTVSIRTCHCSLATQSFLFAPGVILPSPIPPQVLFMCLHLFNILGYSYFYTLKKSDPHPHHLHFHHAVLYHVRPNLNLERLFQLK